MQFQGQDVTTYVFDLDGVMYLGETAIPHAAEAVRRLAGTGKQVYFLTNNSGRTRSDYQEKLARVNGLDVAEHQIYTSAYATALYLKAHGAAGRTVFVIGEAGLARELAELGGLVPVTVADSVPHTDIDYVVVGIDKQFTYDKLRFAHAAITRGHAQFIATNRDSTFPMEDGEIPGGGSLVAALATAAGREPITVGKPEPHAYEAILQAAQAPRRPKRDGRRPPGHGHRGRQPGGRAYRAGADRRNVCGRGGPCPRRLAS